MLYRLGLTKAALDLLSALIERVRGLVGSERLYGLSGGGRTARTALQPKRHRRFPQRDSGAFSRRREEPFTAIVERSLRNLFGTVPLKKSG